MSEPGRPILKLKFTTSQRPPAEVPNTPSTSTPKLMLKVKPKEESQSQTIATDATSASKPKAPRKTQKDKPVRTSNPTAKKRALETLPTSDDEDDLREDAPQPKRKPIIKFVTKANGSSNGVPLSASPSSAPLSSGPNRIKLNYNRTKGAKLRSYKEYGTGYDSCASDAESDPAIEEDFILRMEPGDDCEYLRQAIAEQRFGPRSHGGADVRMTFLQSSGRRAAIAIRGTLYAAAMVDLPCIIEGMKSWDKKAWYKSVDICQMLLVLGKITSEDEALNYPMPYDVDQKTMQYPHGLTPPMYQARTRRFRKRISRNAIEAVESQVDALLKKDEAVREGGSSTWEIIDQALLTQERNERSQSEARQDAMEFGEQDAEGDDDDTQQYDMNEDPDSVHADGLEEELELAMMEVAEDEIDSPMPDSVAATSALPVPPDSGNSALSPASAMVETPAATTPSRGATSGDEESSDEGADSGDEAEVDEDTLEQQQDLQRQRAEILDLENAIKTQQAELERQQNPIFKRKLMSKIQSLREELELRKGAAGEGDEED